MSNPYKLQLKKYSTHRILLNNIGKNKKVLDVGCNDGYIGKTADESNIFYGLDCSKDSINLAKSLYEDAIVYDLNKVSKLPWSIKFDVIIFADVLEHLLDPEKILRFFVENYLKSDGIVIISLPNIANWQIRLRLLFGRFEYSETGILDKTHLHFFTFREARKMLSRNNLNVVREYGGASVLGILIDTFPFMRPLLSTNIIIVVAKK